MKIAILALGLLLSCLAGCGESTSTTKSLFEVTKGSYHDEYLLHGRAMPDLYWQLQVKAENGNPRVISWIVEEGTQVEQGDKLVEYDTYEDRRQLNELSIRLLEEQLKLKKQKAALEKLKLEIPAEIDALEMERVVVRRKSDQADLVLSRIEMNELFRNESLIDLQISQLENSFSTSTRNLKMSIAGLEKQIGVIEAQIDAKTQEIANSVERSPVDGKVTYFRDRLGESFSIGSRVFNEERLLMIADDGAVSVEVDIFSEVASLFTVGTDAKIETNSGVVLWGNLESIGSTHRALSRDDPAEFVTASVGLNENGGYLQPLEKVRVKLTVFSTEEDIVVPNVAIRGDGEGYFVKVYENGELIKKEVEVEKKGSAMTLISGDIKPGHLVLLD